MTDSDGPTETTPGRKERAGFWAGLVLFALLLLTPPGKGMVDAARDTVAAESRRTIAQSLLRRGFVADTPAFIAALDRELAAQDAYLTAEAQRRAQRMPRAAAVTALVAIWWMTVAIPIPVTSLLPLVLFPMLGVLPVREAAVPYANHYIFLFLGGFIIAQGIERWGLHRRIALNLIGRIGTSRRRIVLAFMIATALLSMWMSNTATTVMMLPIALAVIGSIGTTRDDDGAFGAALMLAICYSAGIGGLATLIGTPTNLTFQGQFRLLFPAAPEISFADWVLCFGPLTAIFLPIAWLVLTRVTCRVSAGTDPAHHRVLTDALSKLPPISVSERWMLGIFLTTAMLWMTRTGVRFDAFVIPGWQTLLHRASPSWFPMDYLNDTTVALVMAVLLFILPGGRNRENRPIPLMDWPTALRLPWGMLLLFGGGFTIAHAFQYTGLSGWTGKLLAGTGIEHPLAWVIGSCSLMTFLTELTSNMATLQVMLPVLARTSMQVEINPLVLMLPATISATCAFMLPVATPPNAIVFASGHVSMARMIRSGILLNLIGIVLVTTVIYGWVLWRLGIDPNTVPTWVK